MESVFALLGAIEWWHWWALAGILLSLELLTGTLILLWPAAAAGIVGSFALSPLPFPWPLQWAGFAAFMIVFAMAGERFIRPRFLASSRPELNERVAQLQGRKAQVVTAFADGRGRVEVGGSQWLSRHVSEANPELGDWVEVVDVDGATLLVR